ncbi:MAG TPA: UvrD-helicase domain-containing protein [Myxococcota bacterium]|nr:UvrD-helicase domain-containing protein [Myxococcota bacterium]
MLADAIVADLNPEQREAVQATEGPLLVLAGAGSGKTRVLTHRIAWLIAACGIAPEAILAVTFTNKAASEMRERVAKLLGPDAAGLWVSTFHSSCVRILRRDIERLGRPRSFVIYDDGESQAVLREALRRHGADARGPDARRAHWRIDQWKNVGLRPDEAAARARDVDDERIAVLYRTYQALLAEANALDFGDLLLLVTDLFAQHPDVLARYRERWQYVLVDEYQDTNRVQYRLVTQLAAEHRNLCVVGDVDQSIYGWRGADVRNILDFERDFPEARVVTLDRNYRSTRPILAGADAVVANNRARREKTMRAERGEGEPIRLYRARDDRDEAQFVVQDILQGARSEGRPLGHFAVFYRTNAQSRPFEEELLKYDVPYALVGGIRFYERAEVKDVLAYLRLVVNPRDALALRRIVNVPARGIGKATVERAAALAEARRVPLVEGLRLAAAEGARSGPRVAEFLRLLDALRAEVAALLPVEAIGRALERTGYLRELEREGTPEAEARVENLRELVAGAEDFEGSEDDERSLLEQYLDQVALVSDVDAFEGRHDRVSLMTGHSAKGLEFPVVYLVGMEEGVFPHASATRDDRSVEEERRLCYVGMTRAMERLTLTWATERRRYGSVAFGAPSRFLSEIPASLVVGSTPDAPEPPRFAGGPGGRVLDYSLGQDEPSEPAAGGRGARVRHPIFGEGIVLESQGSGPGRKLRIRFDRAGVKTVILRFANLDFL